MKRTLIILLVMLVGLAGAGVGTRAGAQHLHVRYFDENGNPIEDEHEGHEHEAHEGHEHEAHVEQGQTVAYSFMGLAPRFGLAVQRGLFAEAGVSLDIYRLGYTEASEYASFGYSNLRPYIAGEIMVGRELLGGGKAGVEYIMSTPLFGMAAGIDGAYYTDGASEAITLTPRLMLSFVQVEVFYGYNIFVKNQLTRYVGHHRFGVSMTLSPRFWKRKRAVYSDYYNSYQAPVR